MRFPPAIADMLLDAYAAAVGQPALVTSAIAEVTGARRGLPRLGEGPRGCFQHPAYLRSVTTLGRDGRARVPTLTDTQRADHGPSTLAACGDWSDRPSNRTLVTLWDQRLANERSPASWSAFAIASVSVWLRCQRSPLPAAPGHWSEAQ